MDGGSKWEAASFSTYSSWSISHFLQEIFPRLSEEVPPCNQLSPASAPYPWSSAFLITVGSCLIGVLGFFEGLPWSTDQTSAEQPAQSRRNELVSPRHSGCVLSHSSKAASLILEWDTFGLALMSEDEEAVTPRRKGCFGG